MDQEYSRVTEFESVEFEKRLRRFELERWEGGQVEESFDDEPLPLHVQRRDRERIKKLMENLKAKHPETSGLSFTKGGTVLPKGAIESHSAMLDRIYGVWNVAE